MNQSDFHVLHEGHGGKEPLKEISGASGVISSEFQQKVNFLRVRVQWDIVWEKGVRLAKHPLGSSPVWFSKAEQASLHPLITQTANFLKATCL